MFRPKKKLSLTVLTLALYVFRIFLRAVFANIYNKIMRETIKQGFGESSGSEGCLNEFCQYLRTRNSEEEGSQRVLNDF
jgi:hypothetical protein